MITLILIVLVAAIAAFMFGVGIMFWPIILLLLADVLLVKVLCNLAKNKKDK